MLFSYHGSGSICWSEICQQAGLGLPVLRNAVNYGHLCRGHPIRHQASRFSVSSGVIFLLHGHLNSTQHKTLCCVQVYKLLCHIQVGQTIELYFEH